MRDDDYAEQKTKFQSTHPVRGATVRDDDYAEQKTKFQSTHPVRGATATIKENDDDAAISIHAPREGCDHGIYGTQAQDVIFQSTHPVRGATDQARLHVQRDGLFQSTHPVRGATPFATHKTCNPSISIHAPREGCDLRHT